MTIEAQLTQMQNQILNLTQLVQLAITSLHTKKDVARFLNKSEKTIDNYIKNDTFIENKHYFINENKKIEFIPCAILDFKKNPKHKIKIIEPIKEEPIKLSETTSKILKGIL
jgi:DNA-binding CsgD family transcriptional regulator